jgi:hypothetical protein
MKRAEDEEAALVRVTRAAEEEVPRHRVEKRVIAEISNLRKRMGEDP